MSASVVLVQSVYAAFGRGDLAAVLAACADDVDWRCHAPAAAPFAGRFTGRDGVRTFFEKLLSSARITSFEPRAFLADGDAVVVLGRDTGVAIATGREFADDWVHVFTVRSGRIASFAEFTEAAPLEAAFTRS